MAVNKLDQSLPCKVFIAKDVTFTFSNSWNSSTVDISTITNGVVNSSNILGVAVGNFSWVLIPFTVSNKTKVQLRNDTAANETMTTNLIFFYE